MKQKLEKNSEKNIRPGGSNGSASNKFEERRSGDTKSAGRCAVLKIAIPTVLGKSVWA